MRLLARRPASFLLIDLRTEGFRLRLPLSIFLAADLLASLQLYAWLSDRWLGRKAGKVLGRLPGGGVQTPVATLLALGLDLLRRLPSIGPATLVDVRSGPRTSIRIRLI
ncbi:MAG: hypothetical protein IRZ11_02840 [Clostridia bacterium]|nr:hypothetical protein [Clostridia bacterium]